MRSDETISIRYFVSGAEAVALPALAPSVRADNLWQTTCFEIFVQTRQGGYVELNFSPSTAWAAYAFDGYRAGMRDLPLDPPTLVRRPDGLDVIVNLGNILVASVRVGLSAIIEERDGTKSYWALTHPPEKPDFHDERCFALELPAAV